MPVCFSVCVSLHVCVSICVIVFLGVVLFYSVFVRLSLHFCVSGSQCCCVCVPVPVSFLASGAAAGDNHTLFMQCRLPAGLLIYADESYSNFVTALKLMSLAEGEGCAVLGLDLPELSSFVCAIIWHLRTMA